MALQPTLANRRLSNSKGSLNGSEISRSPSNLSLHSYQSNPSDDENEQNERLLNNPSIQNNTLPTIRVTHPSYRQNADKIDKVRRRLKFYFMDPVQKWHAKGRIPFKLLVQLIKIIFVTLQSVLFGTASYSHINFVHGNSLSLSHYFLLNWDSARDITVYPPALSSYAVYTKSDFYKHIDYAIARYAILQNESIGSYSYSHKEGEIVEVKFCKSVYKIGKIFSYNESYVFDNDIINECLEINPLSWINETAWNGFDAKSYFAANNFTIDFHRLVSAQLIIPLKTVLISDREPDCYELKITIKYDNSEHNGQLKINLDLKQYLRECGGKTSFIDSSTKQRFWLCSLDLIVMITCSFSFILCTRALIKAQRLKRLTNDFFKSQFDKELTLSESLEFLNCWYAVIVINDIIVVIGSLIKMQIESSQISAEAMYIVCSSMLGIGMFLAWFGILRYLKFFSKYNILILTLQSAFPDILRFLLCAGLVYAAFVFNGWLVLGPYHLKFKSLSKASECLFSLINGDDMFASFAITPDTPTWIWWYSRFYFYSFISLFIYVVMSLFIAVIMDAYDTIKNYHLHGFPKSNLMQFVDECPDDVTSGVYRDENSKWNKFVTAVRNCCKKKEEFQCYQQI